MPVERSDYIKLVEREAKKAPTQRDATAFKHMAQAAVALKDLTGQPSWDLFLRYLAGTIEAWSKDKFRAQEALTDPRLGHQQAELLRLQAMLLNERMKVVNAIISLPNELIEMGDKARSIYERMNEDERTGDDGASSEA